MGARAAAHCHPARARRRLGRSLPDGGGGHHAAGPPGRPAVFGPREPTEAQVPTTGTGWTSRCRTCGARLRLLAAAAGEVLPALARARGRRPASPARQLSAGSAPRAGPQVRTAWQRYPQAVQWTTSERGIGTPCSKPSTWSTPRPENGSAAWLIDQILPALVLMLAAYAATFPPCCAAASAAPSSRPRWADLFLCDAGWLACCPWPTPSGCGAGRPRPARPPATLCWACVTANEEGMLAGWGAIFLRGLISPSAGWSGRGRPRADAVVQRLGPATTSARAGTTRWPAPSCWTWHRAATR